jgi:cytochrome c nitrite reductase small subunit
MPKIDDKHPVHPVTAIFNVVSKCVAIWKQIAVGKMRIALLAIMGIFFGLFLLSLQISNAKSYLSNAPEACINCHVMTPYYATWERSSHRSHATCGDCHVPHDNKLRGLYFKMSDGLRHAVVFTMRWEPQVIRLNRSAKQVVQQNCIRCHQHQIMRTSMFSKDDQPLCWTCHRTTPHGRALSLSSSPHVRRPALPSAGLK